MKRVVCRKPALWALMMLAAGVVGALFLATQTASAGHARSRSASVTPHGGHGHGHRGGAGHLPGRRHFRPAHHHGRHYSFYSGPRYYGYSHFFYGTGYRSAYGYGPYFAPRPFPYPTPRIYVYPQARSSRGTGRRVINVISMPPRHIDEAYAGQWEAMEAEAEEVRVPGVEVPLTSGQAWDQLRDGNAPQALSAFAGLASSHPDEVGHTVGYGLAAALAGDKTTAGYALRLAFKVDPWGAASIPVEGVLRDELGVRSREYKEWVATEPDNLNARFLHAVTCHYLGDSAAARACLEEVVQRNDISISMIRLAEVVGESGADTDRTSPEAALARRAAKN